MHFGLLLFLIMIQLMVRGDMSDLWKLSFPSSFPLARNKKNQGSFYSLNSNTEALKWIKM